MTPEQLKASILQYAIQGKLVEQRPEEGTAEDLYNLIKENHPVLKESKGDLVFDAIDFDIPENWKWVELNQLYEFVDYRGKTPNKISEGVFLITASNIRQGYMDYTRKEHISKDEYETRKSRGITEKGDLLFTTEAPMGYAAICDLEECSCGQRVITFKEYVNNTAFPKLFMFFILSPSFQKELIDNCTGTTAKGIKADKLKHLRLPLPPIEEQHRIVAKIEELLPFVDRYAEAYAKLEKFNAKFPEDMKKSILQYAIMGKLVEQRPEEGTAEELYKRIVDDREEKIKNKQIKRDKRANLDDIPKEMPFDIPDNWKWVTLGSILLKLTDGTHKTPKYTESGVKFVSVKDMSSGVLSLDNTKYISADEHIELFSRCDPQKGDMLLSKVGTTGVPAIVDTEEPFSLFVSVSLLKYNHKFIDEKFLYYLLQSPLVQDQANENTRGVGNKNWVLDAIGKTLIVLPPIEEQKRIVAKLEELLPYCDQLLK